MKAYTENLHQELLSKLEELDKNYDPQNLTDSRLHLVVTVIERIKQKLLNYEFESEEEEMDYFKCTLPETLSLYIFYSVKMDWDRILQQGVKESQNEFIAGLLAEAETFRKGNREFFEYCRDGNSERDRFYFLRKHTNYRERPYRLTSITDPHSPTAYCGIKAQFIAHVKLENEMYRLSTIKKLDDPVPLTEEDPLLWTGSKIGLIEVLNAWRFMGAFDHGKASMKKITRCFEKLFGIDLGNYSKQFQEIMTRKTGIINYLHKMIDALQKAIDDIEQEHVRRKRPPNGGLQQG
jgi:hypothetical protein